MKWDVALLGEILDFGTDTIMGWSDRELASWCLSHLLGKGYGVEFPCNQEDRKIATRVNVIKPVAHAVHKDKLHRLSGATIGRSLALAVLEMDSCYGRPRNRCEAETVKMAREAATMLLDLADKVEGELL